MEKRNRMIMFAVIAAIIIAVPISSYELHSSHNTFNVKDSISTAVYYQNTTKLYQTSPMIAIHDNGSMNLTTQSAKSYFNSSSGLFVGYCNFSSDYFANVVYSFGGTFNPSYSPSAVEVSLSVLNANGTINTNEKLNTLQLYSSLPGALNVINKLNDLCVLSGFGSLDFSYILTNQTKVNQHAFYDFYLGSKNVSYYYGQPVIIWINQIANNLTLKLTLSAVGQNYKLTDIFLFYLVFSDAVPSKVGNAK